MVLIFVRCVCDTENLRGFTFLGCLFNVTFSHIVVFEQTVEFNAQLHFFFLVKYIVHVMQLDNCACDAIEHNRLVSVW